MDKICVVPNCGRVAHCKGHCSAHYKRLTGRVKKPMDAPIHQWTPGGDWGEWRVNARGYVHQQRRMPDGTLVSRLQHRVVMEELLGRPLFKNENVHHINGVKSDNRPENLEIWVTTQPSGQRPKDLLEWAYEIIDTYGQ